MTRVVARWKDSQPSRDVTKHKYEVVNFVVANGEISPPLAEHKHNVCVLVYQRRLPKGNIDEKEIS